VPFGLGVGLAHEDGDLAARVAGAGAPPFAAVDHIVVAVSHDFGLNVGGVGRSHFGLGHGEARANLAGQQRLEPAVLLLGRAVLRQHFHVARVGRRAIEHFGGHGRAAHDLAQRGVFQIG
jgi:hypothetical protein